MGNTETRRTLRQVLNYSALSKKPHHLTVSGLGTFHINIDPSYSGVDVILDTPEGVHMRINFDNLEFRLAQLVH